MVDTSASTHVTSLLAVVGSTSLSPLALVLPISPGLSYFSVPSLLRCNATRTLLTPPFHQAVLFDQLSSSVLRIRPLACQHCRSSLPDGSSETNLSPTANFHPGRRQRTQSHQLTRKYPTRCPSPPPLDPLHWINLTNGVEMLPMLSSQVPHHLVRFTRIQSSHCEAGAYDKLLQNVDNDMLLSLAIGRPCLVYDLASRGKDYGVSRALFLGLQFIKWAIAYLWFASDAQSQHLVPSCVLVRGKNTVPFWRQSVLPYRIAKDTKKRIRYFMPYVSEMQTTDVKLYGVYGAPTRLDGCIALHAKFVRDWSEAQTLNELSEQSTVQLDVPRWLSEVGFAVFDSESTCNELRELQRQLTGFGNTDGAA